MGFSNRLESIYPLRILFAYLHHFTKAPFANHFQQIECIDGQRLVPYWSVVDFEVKRASAGGSDVPLI